MTEQGPPDLGAPLAAGRALRAAGRFDRGAISLRAGVVAAIPVTALLALGTVIGPPAVAVSLSVGAMLVGVAWRAGGGPETPPLGTMAAAAVALAVATLAGTVSGRWPWAHLAVLVGFCLAAGLATSLGRRGAVVGTQSIIAFVVFGRFPEPVPQALGLAGLVLAGGAVQTLFAALVAQPSAWRLQRTAVAEAYRALAAIAAVPLTPSVGAAVALDAAEARLTAPALLADRGMMRLSALVDEGRRIRLELIVVGAAGQDRQVPAAAAAAALVSELLDQIAATIEGRAEPGALERGTVELDRWVTGRAPIEDRRLDARLAALAGQVLGAARIALHARDRAGARPTRGSRRIRAGLQSDLRRLRASITLASGAGRHAVRLAAVVAGTELLTQRVALPRGYWAVVAAATVLRPDFAATITRGTERVLGTCAGVLIAGLIAVGIDPGGWGIVAVVGLLGCGMYAVFPASFAAGTALITAVIVFLLHAVAPDSITIALDRALDTAVGGAIGLAAYALWPTWSGTSAGRVLARVVEAQHAYLAAVLDDLLAGRPLAEAQLRPLARSARMNYSDAESAVTLAEAEPVRGTDPRRAAAILAGLRRLVYAVHALRVEAGAVAERRPAPALAPLAAGLGEALDAIAGELTAGDGGGRPSALPPLRDCFRQAVPTLEPELAAAVRIPLDELIDAADTVAASLGIPVS